MLLKKFELQRFRSECEILRIRRDDFTQRIIELDEKVSNYIEKSPLSYDCKNILITKWKDDINEDTDRINNKWSKKMESTKIAFEKDRKYIFDKRQPSTIDEFTPWKNNIKDSKKTFDTDNTTNLHSQETTEVPFVNEDPNAFESNTDQDSVTQQNSSSKNSQITIFQRRILRSSTFQDDT